MSIFFFVTIAVAQEKGKLTGIVTDLNANNAPLPFANVVVKETKNRATTDEKGQFLLELAPGNYKVEFSSVGYESVVKSVVIKEGEATTLNSSIGAGAYTLKDVFISSTKRRNTESAVVMEMKEAKQVISAISAEQMSKGTDGNAAEAIMRVPGISLVDGKFIIVRGLPERYNQVTINNAIAPSTEVDKRTFAFDLIPTDVLDKIVVYKTASADKPADFAGGLVSLSTSENKTEFTKVSVGFGYRDGTSFEDQWQTKTSDTDWLGYDGGLRNLPNGFKSKSEFESIGAEDRQTAGRSLSNNWNPTPNNTFLNTSMGLSLGRKFNIGRVKGYTTNVFTSSQSNQSYARFFSEADGALNLNGTLPNSKSLYSDETYKNNIEHNFMSNWQFDFNPNTKIKFKNFFSQAAENETIIRDGNNIQRSNGNFNNYSFGYKSRTLYSTQLEGIHKRNSGNQLDWVVGYNYISENQPDLRRFRFFDDYSDGKGYFNIAPPSSNLFDNSRFYGRLKEFNATNAVNYTYVLNRDTKDEEFEPFKIKAGYLVDYKYRIFQSRYFSYTLPGGLNLARQNELTTLPLDQIFAPENISVNNGWQLLEGTRQDNSYLSDNFLTAGYVMGDFSFGKLDVNVGLRAENNILRLRYFDVTNEYNKVDNNLLSILPSANLGYGITEKSQVRLGYGRTVNRPEFREIAPFLVYEFEFNVSKEGNTSLTTATIDNFDVRYEWYPRKGEVLSLGGFYKKFKNPIENSQLNATEQRTFTVTNANKATNYGVELEVKKSFKDAFGVSFLDNLSVNLNGSYVFSEVDLGTENDSQDRFRPLQGQSPYIINAGLEYADQKGFGVYLTYNEFGDRIFSVGNTNFATIMEKSRGQFDISVSKKFKNWTIKATAENVLNARNRFYEDTSNNYKIDSKEDFLNTNFRRGALYGLNFSFNF